MAQTYATEVSGVDSSPAVRPSSFAGHGAHLLRYRATITLASQASGDTIVLADIPAGLVPAYGVLNADTSLGTATLSIGNASTPAKYRAAATFTATDTPTPFGKAGAVDDAALTASERVIATIGTAALPASGILVIDLYFSKP
jgi:hypothetical protein